MSGPAPTVFDGQTKFPKEGNAKLSFHGQHIKYNGRLFNVKITDENGERTLTAADTQQLKWVMRILAQAGFADSNCRMNLNDATISQSKVIVSGRTVPLKNDEKVNRLYQKIFQQVLNAGPKVEFVPEESEDEVDAEVDSSDNEAAPAAPKAKQAPKAQSLHKHYEVVTDPNPKIPVAFDLSKYTYNQLWDNNRRKIAKPYDDLEKAVLQILEDAANQNKNVVVIPPVITGNLNSFSSSQIEAIHFYADEAVENAIRKFVSKNPNRELEVKLQVHQLEEAKQEVRTEESAKVEGIKVSIVVGDLTRETHGGAIVNAANAQLSDGSGVTGAIFERARGGCYGVHKGKLKGIEEECQNLIRKKGSALKPGEAAISGAGAMEPNIGSVIHALGPQFSNPPTSAQYNELEMAYYNALVQAHHNGIKVVTFPTISTGIFAGGLSDDDKQKMYQEAAARAMRAIQTFIQRTPRVNFDDIRLIFMSGTGVEKVKMDLAKAELKKVADKP